LKKTESKESTYGGEMMGTALNEKAKITFAIAVLCSIIGVTSLLAVVYYANASNNQIQMNNQINTLQAEKTALENQVASLNAQISTLAQQLNALAIENEELNNLVGNLSRRYSP
jgi:peptidoglycan hydrolase CwlO-like protein